MSKQLKLLDRNTERYIDALYAVLLTTQPVSLFPEMYEIFGREAVLKFLDIFSGQVIHVPSAAQIEEKVRDVTIWVEMKKDGGARLKLMDEFGLRDADIDRIIYTVDQSMKSMNIEVR
jgi:hypothetical protein